MFNLGFSEVVLLAIIALIFIGPKQLPDLARTVGRFLNELKRTTSEIGSTIASPTSYAKEQLDKEVKDIKDQFHGKKRLKSPSEDPLVGHEVADHAHTPEVHQNDQLEFDTKEPSDDTTVSDEHKKDS